ncbi:hypothetical protein HPB50_020937 [Hyalomma asiaticum]|uniref:Uncharacterized protein n=1 Tax=Hyalomma asiaticum TaxID=266040 RepID=A0ACB7T0D2_HYAAI|nr:hypothetical protein HPB50_020937 [Hyalomma asiaticum]
MPSASRQPSVNAASVDDYRYANQSEPANRFRLNNEQQRRDPYPTQRYRTPHPMASGYRGYDNRDRYPMLVDGYEGFEHHREIRPSPVCYSQLCGGCSISILSDSTATVGFWCVRPELRHSTLPEQLLRAALRRAGGRNVVLRSDGCTVRELQRIELFPRVGRWLFHKNFNAHAHTDSVGSYATDVLKMPMDQYLSALSRQPGVVFKVALEGKAVCGLGTIERDVGGCALVRHLMANSVRVAQLLMRSLLLDFPPATSVGVCMVSTGKRFPNEDGPAFFYESLGLQYVSTMLMAFTQREPAIDYNRLLSCRIGHAAVDVAKLLISTAGRT